jgi:tRNA threonylcarbamoyladenosine biosynthesis protein TsaE
MKLRTNSVEETLAFGRLIGQSAPANTCIALHGNLGAGKTHLTRGIALGANIEDPTLVSSPTYVLLNIYRESPNSPSKPVFHMDAYRITSEEDFEVVGFDELLISNGIVVVEWAEKISHLLPDDRVEIIIEAGDADEERLFTITATGDASETFVTHLTTKWPLKNA